MSIRVAVYGTLRRGESANGLMLGAKYLGTDTVKGTLYDLGAFPGLKQNDEDSEVTVDVYELPEDFLPRVDNYEGYRPANEDESLYLRKNTITCEGCLEVMVYVYNHDCAPGWKIESGDWKER